jgi:hypothetical protein
MPSRFDAFLKALFLRRDPAAERTLRSLMTVSADAAWR